MGRRGNGEGSITRRKDGLYMARYTVETATGSKRKAVYAKTRKGVSEKLTAAIAYGGLGASPERHHRRYWRYDRWGLYRPVARRQRARFGSAKYLPA